MIEASINIFKNAGSLESIGGAIDVSLVGSGIHIRSFARLNLLPFSSSSTNSTHNGQPYSLYISPSSDGLVNGSINVSTQGLLSVIQGSGTIIAGFIPVNSNIDTAGEILIESEGGIELTGGLFSSSIELNSIYQVDKTISITNEDLSFARASNYLGQNIGFIDPIELTAPTGSNNQIQFRAIGSYISVVSNSNLYLPSPRDNELATVRIAPVAYQRGTIQTAFIHGQISLSSSPLISNVSLTGPGSIQAGYIPTVVREGYEIPILDPARSLDIVFLSTFPIPQDRILVDSFGNQIYKR